MDLDILIEDARWDAIGLEPLACASISATCEHLGLDENSVEISVLACDDERIAVFNTEFRGKPAATNVLSWPAEDLAAEEDGGTPLAPEAGPDGLFTLGDIAIAYETCAREAAELKKSLEAHVTHLIVHGTLHLLGYDHIRDRDATLMQGIEIQILGKMGLDDPYMT